MLYGRLKSSIPSTNEFIALFFSSFTSCFSRAKVIPQYCRYRPSIQRKQDAIETFKILAKNYLPVTHAFKYGFRGAGRYIAEYYFALK